MRSDRSQVRPATGRRLQLPSLAFGPRLPCALTRIRCRTGRSRSIFHVLRRCARPSTHGMLMHTSRMKCRVAMHRRVTIMLRPFTDLAHTNYSRLAGLRMGWWYKFAAVIGYRDDRPRKHHGKHLLSFIVFTFYLALCVTDAVLAACRRILM
jgi:hypothetical protein